MNLNKLRHNPHHGDHPEIKKKGNWHTQLLDLVLVSRDGHRKPSDLKMQKFILVVLEARNQTRAVSKFGSFWKLWERVHSRPLSWLPVATSNSCHSSAHGHEALISTSIFPSVSLYLRSPLFCLIRTPVIGLRADCKSRVISPHYPYPRSICSEGDTHRFGGLGLRHFFLEKTIWHTIHFKGITLSEKEPIAKGYILYNSIYILFLK